MLIRGYADPIRANTEFGITLDEFRQAYLDVRELGIELQFLDKFDPKVPEKRFAEANYFSFVANGDEYLDLAEATQMFAFAVSARVSGDDTYAKLKAEDCHDRNRPRFDEFNLEMIEQKCFEDRYYWHFDKHLWNLPLFVSSKRSLGLKAQKEFQKIYEASGRKSNYPGWVTSGDIQALSMLASYVEALFYRFDRDRSGTFTYDEAAEAFPIFRKTLSEIRCTNDDKQLRKAFDYLMEKGGEPEGWQILTQAIPWQIDRWWEELWGNKPNYRADRMKVLKIFAQFSTRERPTPICRAPESKF
jgi:hypothetical protein